MTDNLSATRMLVGTTGLSVSSQSEVCPECVARVPSVPDGPTHRYLGASPGCWTLYTVLLAREFSAFDARTHQLSVDAYAAQHPGTPSPLTIQSICTHLVALCLSLEHDLGVESLRAVVGDLSKGRYFEPRWLEPPALPYAMTIVDLVDAAPPRVYGERVRRWAEATWQAWTTHHDEARKWTNLTLA